MAAGDGSNKIYGFMITETLNATVPAVAARNIGTDSQVRNPGSRLLVVIISTQP
jgi:hypothetical protein